MLDEESKKLLLDIFSILGFSEEEKKGALLDFKKKIAWEIMHSIKPELPKEYQDFLDGAGLKVTDPNHPMVAKIRDIVKKLHSTEEYREKSKRIFKGLVRDYVDYMKQKLDADKVSLIENLVAHL